MDHSQEYRARAAQLRSDLESLTNPGNRLMLILLIDQYERLAEELEGPVKEGAKPRPHQN